MSEVEILPTNTCPPDLDELARRTEAFAAFAPWVHLDISDGVFTPITSWPYGPDQWKELESQEHLHGTPNVRYEAHLMVEDPTELGLMLAEAGCERVIGHLEVFRGAAAVREMFSYWKEAGAKETGVAIMLDTPTVTLEEIAADCDVVLLMSIATLGSQGAPFDERIFPRVQELRNSFPELTIAVDGGVNENNVQQLVQAGATRFGVGSAISKAPDPAAAYKRLLELATSA